MYTTTRVDYLKSSNSKTRKFWGPESMRKGKGDLWERVEREVSNRGSDEPNRYNLKNGTSYNIQTYYKEPNRSSRKLCC